MTQCPDPLDIFGLKSASEDFHSQMPMLKTNQRNKELFPDFSMNMCQECIY
ncbi:hypothetical protein Sjap_025104 [Stephania japonica]|uniref:Uncharacterized protein n=1 Tax=Stephania japonica TaxID=461633 RepID=A0AAP0E471_9MAGN